MDILIGFSTLASLFILIVISSQLSDVVKLLKETRRG